MSGTTSSDFQVATSASDGKRAECVKTRASSIPIRHSPSNTNRGPGLHPKCNPYRIMGNPRTADPAGSSGAGR